jgi:hypothetical protein
MPPADRACSFLATHNRPCAQMAGVTRLRWRVFPREPVCARPIRTHPESGAGGPDRTKWMPLVTPCRDTEQLPSQPPV